MIRTFATISYATSSSSGDEEDVYPEDGVPSWFNEQPGTRMLRKSNQRMGTADVYKQNRNQEEDMLTPDRLKKGYQMPVTQYELQSLVFNASENKLVRLEKSQKRSQTMMAMILYRKGEFNMTFDRDRKTPKDEIPRFAVYNWKRILSDRVKFFSALGRGVPLKDLSRKIPSYRKKETLLNEFYDYNVSYDRALWCVKIMCILGFTTSSNRQKKTMLDVASAELSQVSTKSIIVLLNAMLKTIVKKSKLELQREIEGRKPNESSNLNVPVDETDPEKPLDEISQLNKRLIEYNKMWKYKTEFIKYMYKDGVVDRQEYLGDLCETFTVFFIRRRVNEPTLLTMFLRYFYYYTEDLSHNLILARRAANIMCQEIRVLYDTTGLARKTIEYVKENAETGELYVDAELITERRKELNWDEVVVDSPVEEKEVEPKTPFFAKPANPVKSNGRHETKKGTRHSGHFDTENMDWEHSQVHKKRKESSKRGQKEISQWWDATNAAKASDSTSDEEDITDSEKEESGDDAEPMELQPMIEKAVNFVQRELDRPKFSIPTVDNFLRMENLEYVPAPPLFGPTPEEKAEAAKKKAEQEAVEKEEAEKKAVEEAAKTEADEKESADKKATQAETQESFLPPSAESSLEPFTPPFRVTEDPHMMEEEEGPMSSSSSGSETTPFINSKTLRAQIKQEPMDDGYERADFSASRSYSNSRFRHFNVKEEPIDDGYEYMNYGGNSRMQMPSPPNQVEFVEFVPPGQNEQKIPKREIGWSPEVSDNDFEMSDLKSLDVNKQGEKRAAEEGATHSWDDQADETAELEEMPFSPAPVAFSSRRFHRAYDSASSMSSCTSSEDLSMSSVSSDAEEPTFLEPNQHEFDGQMNHYNVNKYEQPPITRMTGRKYANMSYPFWLDHGGSAVDPYNEDQMDFRNPTPPPREEKEPQTFDFESSPSESPAPPDEGDDKEKGDKDDKDSDKNKEKEKESPEEKAKAAARLLAEHANDLDVPMNPEDIEAMEIERKELEAKESAKKEEKERAERRAKGIVTPEPKPDEELEKKDNEESDDVEMKEVKDDEKTNRDTTKADEDTGMEVDSDPSTTVAETSDIVVIEDKKGSKKTPERSDENGEKKPEDERMEVDVQENEEKKNEEEDDDDLIILTPPPKTDDPDEIVVIGVVEKEKEKPKEKSVEPEKTIEKETDEKPVEKKDDTPVPPTSVPVSENSQASYQFSNLNEPSLFFSNFTASEHYFFQPPVQQPQTKEKQSKPGKLVKRKTPELEDTDSELTPEEKQAKLEAEIEEEDAAREEEWRNGPIDPGFMALDECDFYREPLLLMSSVVQYLAAVTPECLIWNDLKVKKGRRRPRMLPQLCGSPLDYLPCEIYRLPYVTENDDHLEILKLRHHEIHRRSKAVEDKWLAPGTDVLSFGRIIDACVDVIGIMDNIDVEKPNALGIAAKRLFTFREKYAKEEALLRTKLMFKWCITDEREGSFRPVFIAQLLAYGKMMHPEQTIGGWDVMDLFFNFMKTEGPKHGAKNFQAQFDAAASIMIEMLRHRIFNITDILHEMQLEEDLDFNEPLMWRQRKQKLPKMPKNRNQAQDETKLVHYKQEFTPKRLFMGKKMDLLERMIIILPQLDFESADEVRLRRMLLFGLRPEGNLYFRRARSIYRSIWSELKKKLCLDFDVDEQIVTCHRKVNQRRLDELTRQFRAQTYHDQHLIIKKIAESYVDSLAKFLLPGTIEIVSPEVLNIICEMYENSQDITSIFDFFETVNPFLPRIDDKIVQANMDVIPYMYCTETTFIFVSFFMKHWQRFLLHERACSIVNQCYLLIREMLNNDKCVMTAWGRTIGVFVFHARKYIKNAGLQTEEFIARDGNFWRVFPNTKHFDVEVGHFNQDFARRTLSLRGGELRYDALVDFNKILKNLKTTSKKKSFPKRSSNRYSFVIRAFIESVKHGKHFDRVNELATYCANITANDPPLSEYWIAAIKGLCCLSLETPYPFREISESVDIADCSLHYALVTFIVCLAGKSAYYVPRLLSELTKHIFPLMLRPDGRLSTSRNREIKRKSAPKVTETRIVSDAEPGVTLALMIIAGLCCVGDEPFGLSVHYTGCERKRKRFNETGDERIMHLFHWFEMDQAMFRTLGHISQLLEALRSRHKDAKLVLPVAFRAKDNYRQRRRIIMQHMEEFPDDDPPHIPKEQHVPAYYRPQFLFNIAKTVQFVICEQDWVTLRMFRFFKTRKMEVFNQDKLKQNCLGQQILRMALRRRTERPNVEKLFEAHAISKKATVDKVLSFMTLWNFRATLFDLMLMIKEISPDGNTRHAQQGAIAADALMSEIGKCCRDMFVFAHKNKVKMPIVKMLENFCLSDVNKYWLIAPLVRMCPKPINIPPQYANTTVGTVAAKFLREAAALMDTPALAPKERMAISAWAMSRQPFINMILTCLRCERSQQSKDVFLSALYGQLQKEVIKERNKKTVCLHRRDHRDCTMLRLNIVGYIYKEILKPTHVEPWGLLLFQLLYNGIINPVRECQIYDTTIDMLQHMILWTLVDGDSVNHHDRYGAVRIRWPQYSALMKKMRKEADGKLPDYARQSLYRFLPIVKAQTNIIAVKKYQTKPKYVSRLYKKHPCAIGLRHGRYAFLPEEKLKTNAFDSLEGFMADGFFKGGWRYHWFHPTKLDKVAKIIPHALRTMVYHTHHNEFPRPALIPSDQLIDDLYLCPPEVEITGTVELPEEPMEEGEEREKTEAEKVEEKKKADEKKKEKGDENKADDEKKDEKTAEVANEKDKDKEKDGENKKEKEKDGGKKDETSSSLKPEAEAEKNKKQNANGQDAENAVKDETSTKAAPVARSSPATGRGRGRKRNSGAGRGGPRAKRTNSRNDATQQPSTSTGAWNAPGTSTTSGGNYHNRGNQPPMNNGSSEETKQNLQKLIKRKQEKNAAAAAAAASGGAAPPVSTGPPTLTPLQMPPMGMPNQQQQLPGINALRSTNPVGMPGQMGGMAPGMNPPMHPSMHTSVASSMGSSSNPMNTSSMSQPMGSGMGPGMNPTLGGMTQPGLGSALSQDPNQTHSSSMGGGMHQQQAPPPYSSSSGTSSSSMFANQPHFAQPNPGPLSRLPTNAPMTAEARKQLMERQMHEKLAQQNVIMEQQQKNRIVREAAEKQKQDEDEARRRAIHENNRVMEEARFAREREEQARQEQLRQEACRAEQARIQREREEQMRLQREREEMLRVQREQEEQARMQREREEFERQERARIQREREAEEARQEAIRIEMARQEAARQEAARLERERLAREAEEKARREREEQQRIMEQQRQQKEREAREARERELAMKAREEEMRRAMEAQRQKAEAEAAARAAQEARAAQAAQAAQQAQKAQANQYMNQQQQPPAYGQQSQRQPPSYQQGSYQNPGYQQQGQQQGQQPNQPPSYQQPSHLGQSGQQQPPAYQQATNQMQMNMQQQQQQYGSGMGQGIGQGMTQNQQRSEFGQFGQQSQQGAGQNAQQNQGQRNMFPGQPNMQNQADPMATKMLTHQPKPSDAHAQQYQHTQNQMARAQREREAQYMQAKMQGAPNQRFGETSAANASGFGRNMAAFGQTQAGSTDFSAQAAQMKSSMNTAQKPWPQQQAQQQAQQQSQQPSQQQIPPANNPMQNQHQMQGNFQQPVLGQPGPMQLGTGAQQPGNQQNQQQQGGYAPSTRQPLLPTPTPSELAMRMEAGRSGGAMNQMGGRMGQHQGYGGQQANQDMANRSFQGQQHPQAAQKPAGTGMPGASGGYPQPGMDRMQQMQQHQQQQQKQQQQQYPGMGGAGAGGQMPHMGQGQGQGQQTQPNQQFGNRPDQTGYQQQQPGGYQQQQQQQGFQPRPDQQAQPQGMQHNQYGGANQTQNQMRPQQPQQPVQAAQQPQGQMQQQPGQYGRNPQEQQYQQQQQAQAQQAKPQMGGQQGNQYRHEGFTSAGGNQYGNAGNMGGQQNPQMHQQQAQQGQQANQYGQQQQPQANRFGGYPGGQQGSSNILNQSMEESGLNMPTGGHGMQQQQQHPKPNVPAQNPQGGMNMMPQQQGYDRHGMQQNNPMHMQQQQQHMAAQQNQRMGQPGIGGGMQQPHQQQVGMNAGRPGMGMGGQQPQQTQQPQVQNPQMGQGQRGMMGAGGQVPGYNNMNQTQQHHGQQEQYRGPGMGAAMGQMGQQQQQNRMQQPGMGQAQQQQNYGNPMQPQQQQMQNQMHRGQQPHGMGHMQPQHGGQPNANQYYQQQQQPDSRMHQQGQGQQNQQWGHYNNQQY